MFIPGVPCHAIQHGNNGSAYCYADEDYPLYLDTLKEQAKKYDCLVHHIGWRKGCSINKRKCKLT